MKFILPGLLGLGEQAPVTSFGEDPLLASTHPQPVDGHTHTLTGTAERTGSTAAAAAAGPEAGLSTAGASPWSSAASVLEAVFESLAKVERPRISPLQQADGDHHHEHDHDHSGGICAGLLSEGAWLASQGMADATLSSSGPVTLSTPLVALEQTFRLHSNPGASKTIYLDFNGHTTSGTSWNNSTMGSSFDSPAFNTDGDASSFSSNELITIQRAWQRVAADFSCFDVNVTTQAPPNDWLIKSSSTDANYGIRVVITSFGPSSSTAGGIAYINSFNWNSDTPCFVYNTSLLGVSEAISHEVGHSLGLSHDGTATASYYQGHGSGETGWAPIMGVGYYKSVTTWDNGTFTGSTNTGAAANYNKGADDLAIITGLNGFTYQADLEGNSLASATALSIAAGNVSQFGTIETAADNDWFRFDLIESGSLNLTFNPYVYASYLDGDDLWGGSLTPWFSTVSDVSTSTSWVENGSNLDLSVALLNAGGMVLASSNPSGLAASLNVSGLAAGTYYLRLDGVGFGDPTALTPTGYSDYASIGDYLISGTISGAGATVAALPVVSLALSPSSVSEDGTTNLLYTFSRSGDASASLDVSFSVGGSAQAGVDYTGLSGSGSTQTIRFAAGATTAQLSLDPSADSSVEANETISLTLLSGSDYSLGTSTAVTGTITNDDIAPATAFSTALDVLTGSGGSSDTFQLQRLSDALISPGSSFSCDRITNLEAGIDRIDTPSTRTTAIAPKQLGRVSALTASAIGSVLDAKGAFNRNGASTFTYADPLAGQRTFLALNDGTTGFNASSDAIIEITGYSGSLSALQVF
ncbi:MAG: bluetail domain-containing putative surface protein [Vulcanococcus sp.]